MLRFEINLPRIAVQQSLLIGSGLRGGLVEAQYIKAFRVALEGLARRFNARGVLPDGRVATVDGALRSIGTPPTTARGVALLRGLDFASIVPWPDRVGRGRVAPFTVDPHSYLFRFDEPPPSRFEVVEMSALGVYLDPYQVMLVLWVGRPEDHDRAFDALRLETQGFTNWENVHALYDDWLKSCDA